MLHEQVRVRIHSVVRCVYAAMTNQRPAYSLVQHSTETFALKAREYIQVCSNTVVAKPNLRQTVGARVIRPIRCDGVRPLSMSEAVHLSFNEPPHTCNTANVSAAFRDSDTLVATTTTTTRQQRQWSR